MTSVRPAIKSQYAQGEVVSLFGFNLTGLTSSTFTAANSSGIPLVIELARSQVLVDGIPAPLYFAFTGTDGASQINLQLPYSLTPGSHKLRVITSSGLNSSSADYSFVVTTVSPSYSGSDTVPLFVQNLTQGPAGNVFVTGNTPVRPGDVVVVYATGLGATNPPVKEGEVPRNGVLATVLAPVTVLIRSGNSQWIPELFGAVESPVYPGLYQIAFRVPSDTDSGTSPTIDLLLAVGGDVQTFKLNFVR
jgi:uncharacterized protein (TIGR03437 family)